MRPRDLFLHPSEARLRAPWRLGLHALVCVLVSVGVAVLARYGPTFSFEAWWTAQLALVVSVTLLVARAVDRRRGWARTLGLSARGALDLGAGVVLGAALIGGVASLEVALGLTTIEPSVAGVDGWALAGSLVLFAAIACSEELLFRGYQLTNLAEGLARDPARRGRAVGGALVLASGAFGLAHAANPNATVLAVVNVTLAGVLLGVPFVMTGRLGFSMGLHFSWNVTQSLLDMPVSGQRVGVPIVLRTGASDEWLTGGAFGPEAGALGLGAIVLGTVLGAAWARVTTGGLALAPGLGAPPPPPPPRDSS